MSKEGNIRGSLRKSQIILGLGPGSIVDLKKGSVIISGISKWDDYDKDKDIIHSPKLERLLGVKYFVTPPHKKAIRYEDGTEIPQRDILAYQFPRWGYCPVCKKLGEIGDFIVKRAESGYVLATIKLRLYHQDLLLCVRMDTYQIFHIENGFMKKVEI